MIRFIRFFLFALVLPQAGIAQTTLSLANDPEEGKTVFHEALLKAARISGAVVVGVQARTLVEGPVDFRAHVPAAWADQMICVRVVSADGLYEAVNTYHVDAAWRGGSAEFPYPDVPFPTEYGQRLSESVANGLAIRVSRGDCTAGQTTEATVAFWNTTALTELTLLINSFRADRVFAYVGQDAPPVKCEPVDLQGRTAYDTVCVIKDRPQPGNVDVSIYRVKTGGASAEDKITVVFPKE